MPDTATPRHGLPHLFVGQAQKEVTHNEALGRIDGLLHPVIEDERAAPPSALSAADDGRCWLIMTAATGLWTGKSGQIARWSGGSWRYFLPCEGMCIFDEASGIRRFYIGGAWTSPDAIANPVGGTIVDAEARAALVSVLALLREIRLIPL